MIKEAIEKIASLAAATTFEINGDTYSDKRLERIAPHVDKPTTMGFTSLDGIVQAIKAEIMRTEVTKPIFVSVTLPNCVLVHTTLRNDDLQRDILYSAAPGLPDPFTTWNTHENAIIMLRSRFVPNEDVNYLLDLLGRISSEDSVTSEDSGVSQSVTATVGVALKQSVTIKQRVLLAPFRTFLEVEQPESEFILRIKAGNKEAGTLPEIGIIEADGGVWKLKAKRNIADYFRQHLAELIKDGSVIVAE